MTDPVAEMIAHKPAQCADCPRNGHCASLSRSAIRNVVGDSIRALAIALNTVGMVSIDRVHKILSGTFALPVSTGTIARMVRQFGQAVRATAVLVIQRFAARLVRSPFAP